MGLRRHQVVPLVYSSSRISFRYTFSFPWGEANNRCIYYSETTGREGGNYGTKLYIRSAINNFQLALFGCCRKGRATSLQPCRAAHRRSNPGSTAPVSSGYRFGHVRWQGGGCRSAPAPPLLPPAPAPSAGAEAALPSPPAGVRKGTAELCCARCRGCI